MDEQIRRDIANLVQAARDILEFVADPGERPTDYQIQDYQTLTFGYRQPKSEAQIARENADRLERQSRVVRRLRRELGIWVDWQASPPTAQEQR